MTPNSPAGNALRLEIIEGDIALVTFDQPGSRANTMGQAIIAEWNRLLDDLSKRTDVHGLILRSGKPGMFVAGADLKELGSIPTGKPEAVRPLIDSALSTFARIEALPYPTVAAIDGPCLGGGMELALGFDERVAGDHPKAEFGFPEVKVGLIPGWGGTQRMARVIGAPATAELICTGEPVNAKRALELGIVSAVVASADLTSQAVRTLRNAASSGSWQGAREKKRSPISLSLTRLNEIIDVSRKQILARTKGHLPAPLAALEALRKGGPLPLTEGIRAETEAFLPLAGSTISRNLIAVFFMNQRLQKDPGVADAGIKPGNVERVGVLGAGIMGSGIAGAHVRRGLPVVLMDNFPGAIEKGLANITKVVQGRIDAGRAGPDDLKAVLARVTTSAELGAVKDCDVVIEAVVENESTKVQVFKDLQPILKPNAILASNTSTISISRMAKAVSQPERFAGMHFFNPVDRMQLVEVIRGEKTSDETVVTLVALAKRIGKTPIVVNDCPGFLVNRILFPYLNEALVLLEEGADPRALDQAATEFGMPMGPITLYDVVGLDTALFAGQVVNIAFADRTKSSAILDTLVKQGRLGQKSGAGFYSYAGGSRGADDPALAGVIEACRTGKRAFGTPELIDRLFLPMLIEASLVLTEKIVRDPADVDMGLLLGIGFPAFRGGILRWADTLGLRNVLETLKRYEPLGRRYHPTAQMKTLASEGKGFYG